MSSHHQYYTFSIASGEEWTMDSKVDKHSRSNAEESSKVDKHSRSNAEESSKVDKHSRSNAEESGSPVVSLEQLK